MRTATPLFPARCTLHVDRRLLPALPVHIDGQAAAIVVEGAPRGARPVRLLVDWDQGGTTELSGRLKPGPSNDGITRLVVHAVNGDWQPFLAWLGARATS